MPGDGPFNGDPDVLNFDSQSTMPKLFLFHRVPRNGSFQFSDAGGLEITPSRTNLTGVTHTDDLALKGQRGISFVGRRQTQTVFHFSVDVDASSATEIGQEPGISIFLAQENHADILIVYLNPCSEDKPAGLHLRFRAHGEDAPPSRTMALPADWVDAASIRLHILSRDTQAFYLGASLGHGDMIELGEVWGGLVSHLDSAQSGTLSGRWSVRLRLATVLVRAMTVLGSLWEGFGGGGTRQLRGVSRRMSLLKFEMETISLIRLNFAAMIHWLHAV